MINAKENTSRYKSSKGLFILVIAIGVLSIISAAVGVFYTTGGKPYEVTNIYGDNITMWGVGLYKNDSYFKAPLNRGTDLVELLFSIPILFIGLIQDIRKRTIKSRLFLVSTLGIFVYSSASYCFGVAYNQMHLIYIALLSCSLFGLIMGIRSIDHEEIIKKMSGNLAHKGLISFSVLTGIALIVAWLPDILSSLLTGNSLSLIETYTTEITYVIDMGIIAPSFFATIYLIRKNDGLGYTTFLTTTMICILMIPILCFQSIFQSAAGIETPLAAAITKIGSFIVLGFWAIYLQVKIYRDIRD